MSTKPRQTATENRPNTQPTATPSTLPMWLFTMEPGEKALRVFENDEGFRVDYLELLPTDPATLDYHGLQDDLLKRGLYRVFRLYGAARPDGYEYPEVLALWEVHVSLGEPEFECLKRAGFPEALPDLLSVLLDRAVAAPRAKGGAPMTEKRGKDALIPVLLPRYLVEAGYDFELPTADDMAEFPERAGWKVRAKPGDKYRMTCPVCRGLHDLPARAAFCTWCGASLEGVMSYEA